MRDFCSNGAELRDWELLQLRAVQHGGVYRGDRQELYQCYYIVGYSLTYSLTALRTHCFFTYSLIYSLTHSLTHLLSPTVIDKFTQYI